MASIPSSVSHVNIGMLTSASRMFACAMLILGPLADSVTVTNRDVFVGYVDDGRNSSSDSMTIEGEAALVSLLAAVAICFVGVSCCGMFSALRPTTSNFIGAKCMERTTSPLAGIQLFLIFLATSLSIAAAVSPNYIVVVAANDLVGVQYSSLGIWYQDNAFGTASDSVDPDRYPCSVFLPSSNMTKYSPASWTYSNYCQGVRTASCIPAVAGIVALLFGFYNRQRMVLPLLLVCVGAWVYTLVTWQVHLLPKVYDMQPKVEDVTMYFVLGNGFQVLIFALVCFMAEILCWFIDWFRLKPHTAYKRVVN
eukprot:m.205356 g.205356  ORF g.205356 m.205356 type:complete len:309 (-) comp32911_c0_seq3:295-1221(-)